MQGHRYNICIILTFLFSLTFTTLCFAEISIPQNYPGDIPKGYERISFYSIPYPKSKSDRSESYNVSLALLRIDGTLLNCGKRFSFSDAVGQRNAAAGFEKGSSYNGNGAVVSSYGGGICRVASALYNCILNAGIIPTERHPHSGRVSYAPYGLDAAISEGCKDLVFFNTLNSPIYIAAFAGDDASGTYSLQIELYAQQGVMGGVRYIPSSIKVGPNTYDAYLTSMIGEQKLSSVFLDRSVY